MSGAEAQPSQIGDLGLIGNRHTAALVSRTGAIEWLCLPRFDSGACFARLLGGDEAGFCRVGPAGGGEASARSYLEGTMILQSEFGAKVSGGRARLIDLMLLPDRAGHPTLLRLLEGIEGEFEYEIEVRARFDYGAVRPWLREPETGIFTLVGGNDGLVVWRSDKAELTTVGDHDLQAHGRVAAGETVCLSLTYRDPIELDRGGPEWLAGRDADPMELLQATAEWWRGSEARWEGAAGADAERVRRSAIVLRALTYEPSGAMVAAPTTSLPEVAGGSRNWDYRYSWVRDSVLAVRALAEVGLDQEARGFRRFIERSAAGHADELQILFGVGGERRIVEIEVPELNGYRESRPVRVGNAAHSQLQLDAYGQIIDQAWHWMQRGEDPEPDYWPFLRGLIEAAAEHWREPDCGIWEWRDEPRHFVHSKALCWAALTRGVEIAEAVGAEVPAGDWQAAAEEIRAAIDREGYDRGRGVFLQAFGRPDLDAAVLRLPTVGFLEWTDSRMVSTAEVLARELDEGGLLRRYSADDGLEGREGAFLPCTYWLATCFAHQDQRDRAREMFDRANACANDLGLLSEEFAPAASGEAGESQGEQLHDQAFRGGRYRGGEMLGNFPQALSHLSQIEAALAIQRCEAGAV